MLLRHSPGIWAGARSRRNDSEHSDIKGSPPVQRGNVSLTNVPVRNAIYMWPSRAVSGGKLREHICFLILER
jgi:hypothetical protein